MMEEERLRGAIVYGEVLSIDDTGEAQVVTVRTHENITRSGVEVASIHGLASNPGDGATALMLAIGGDQAHFVALPLMGVGTRFGKLPKGGVALYDDAGNFLQLTADGNALLALAALLRVVAKTVSIEAQGGVSFHGPVTFFDVVTFEQPVTFAAGVTMQGDATVGGSLHVTGPVTGASFNGR